MDKVMVMLVSLLIICVVFIVFAFYKLDQIDKECTEAGGKWVGTGEYSTTTTYVQSGKVLVPITSTTEIKECVKP